MLRGVASLSGKWPLPSGKVEATRVARPSVLVNVIRNHPVFVADASNTAAFLKEGRHLSHERRRLFWSGDRLEWLLSRGFLDWFVAEVRAGRTVYPG
jgi:hypothetical protein